MRPIVLALALTGCAGQEQYWTRGSDYFPSRIEVVEVADPGPVCGGVHKTLGCAIRLNAGLTGPVAVVFIRRGLPIHLRDCVAMHELKHAIGYNHPDRPSIAYADCGDGTQVWL